MAEPTECLEASLQKFLQCAEAGKVGRRTGGAQGQSNQRLPDGTGELLADAHNELDLAAAILETSAAAVGLRVCCR